MDYRQTTKPSLALDQLDEKSRIWIYQSDRVLSDNECLVLQSKLDLFTQGWTSHNRSLKASASIFYNRFIVVFLDEQASSGASGCSIDKLVHFITDLGRNIDADFMNRMLFHILQNDSIMAVPLHELSKMIKEGIIDNKALVFDSLVKDKKTWENRWLVPLEESWHNRFI